MQPRGVLSVIGVGLAVVLGGCVAQPKSAPPPMPPSPEMVEQMRASYKQAFPDARLGVVTAVLPDADYALVGEIETAGIAEGAYVSFLDAEETVIANGTVAKVEPTGLTVRFDAGQRRPIVGDAAVNFKR